MSIKPVCNLCGDDLNSPGGLAFSPPTTVEKSAPVIKYHLCAERCWPAFEDFIDDAIDSGEYHKLRRRFDHLVVEADR